MSTYVFRGGYIEDESGDRWWSAELLAKVEKERDDARAQIAELKDLLSLIRETGALREFAYERGDDDASIAELLVYLLKRNEK